MWSRVCAASARLPRRRLDGPRPERPAARGARGVRHPALEHHAREPGPAEGAARVRLQPGRVCQSRRAGCRAGGRAQSDRLVRPASRVESRRGQAEVDKNVAAIVERVGKHPAVYGYYLRDEPNASLFPALARYAAAIRKADADARPYINLFPNYANAEQLGTPTYEAYLEKFIATVQPPFVSYDHYALMDDGSLRDGYFQNLLAVAESGDRAQPAVLEHRAFQLHFRYAEPTEAGLRFQAFTTLAAGGRGISYFTYITPTSGNYRLAPIDQFGNRTPTWDMLRRVNLQIHALAPTLVKLKSVGVLVDATRHVAESRHLAELSADAPLFLGEFEDAAGKSYVMIVNAACIARLIAVRFKRGGTIVHISTTTPVSRQAWRARIPGWRRTRRAADDGR